VLLLAVKKKKLLLQLLLLQLSKSPLTQLLLHLPLPLRSNSKQIHADSSALKAAVVTKTPASNCWCFFMFNEAKHDLTQFDPAKTLELRGDR
jgi:hypothetical protein